MSEVFTDGLKDEPLLRKNIEKYLNEGEEPEKAQVRFIHIKPNVTEIILAGLNLVEPKTVSFPLCKLALIKKGE